MEKQKLETACLDGIKGLGACVIAFVWHYQHFSPQNGSPFYSLIPGLYSYGWLMVEVFFMLSGFGMAMGYTSKIRNKELSFQEYMVRRIKRLYPVMIVSLLLTTILERIYKAEVGTTFIYSNFDTYHFFLNLFGLQNGIFELGWSFNAPSWSISIILICYVGFYILTSKVIRAENLLWVYLAAGFCGCAILLSGLELPLFNSLVARGVSCFFFGAFLKEIYMRVAESKHRTIIGYGSFLTVVICYLQARFFGFAAWGNVQMTVIIVVAPLMILGILFVPWLNKIFGIKPLNILGKLSLAVYLFHFPVQCLIKIVDISLELGINYSSKIIWCLYAGIVLLTAICYEYFISKRIYKIIK